MTLPDPLPTADAPTLVEFLLARIAEDEVFWNAMPFGPTFGHAEMWERMKSECEAKRRIVLEMGRLAGDLRPTSNLDEDGWVLLCWETLEQLASVYADHPDYRQEWNR